MQDILKTFINNVKTQIPGFIAVSINEIATGESYDSYTADKDFDPLLASAYNLEVVKAKINAISALGLKEDIKDITITLTDQIHMINISESGIFFIYLAVDSSKGNLGIIRSLLNKYKEDLNKIL